MNVMCYINHIILLMTVPEMNCFPGFPVIISPVRTGVIGLLHFSGRLPDSRNASLP